MKPGHFYVDLGAHKGLTIDAWLKQHPDSIVLGVEANPDLAAALQAKYAGKPSVTIVAAAAGTRDGTATFYPGIRSDESGTLVLGKPDSYKYNVDYANGTPVPVVDTAALIRRHIPNRFKRATIKIDIEGGEYELIPHLIKTGAMGLFSEARVEWHAHKFDIPQATHDAVFAAMNRAVNRVLNWK